MYLKLRFPHPLTSSFFPFFFLPPPSSSLLPSLYLFPRKFHFTNDRDSFHPNRVWQIFMIIITSESYPYWSIARKRQPQDWAALIGIEPITEYNPHRHSLGAAIFPACSRSRSFRSFLPPVELLPSQSASKVSTYSSLCTVRQVAFHCSRNMTYICFQTSYVLPSWFCLFKGASLCALFLNRPIMSCLIAVVMGDKLCDFLREEK